MSRYDFRSLSHQDFEELTRDLLQAEWNVLLESFKAGRDEGIDLRYAPLDDGKTIIQCKHYVGSGFSKLLNHLKNTERPKIERLSPDRYVVVTSVALTPTNKDSIYDALTPFVKSPSDIMGAGEIEGLLSRYPAVERANFKLWLTSTSVIERVLHNAQLCHTDFQVERIRRKLPLYVQSEAFPRAMRHLADSRTVVISGAPGIGKTTLADILLYAHLEEGYEPVVVQAEIAEGMRFFRKNVKQVFYYDDFLGQTFLSDRSEYLGRNQDSALIDFMEMVQQSDHARFILTTREHILKAALQTSERFVHSLILDHKCVLELSDYTYGDKAKILYNHLYFSTLPQTYKDAVLQDAFFLKVIRHEHFNPRLIEWLSTQARLRDVSPSDYQAHITALLASPEKIWNHAFQSQISDAGRNMLLSVYTLGMWTDVSEVEPAFLSIHRHHAAKYLRSTAPEDCRKALQELDGGFLAYNSATVRFLNPSVREFIASIICDSSETVKNLLAASIRFQQVLRLWQLSEAHPESQLRQTFLRERDLVLRILTELLPSPSICWVTKANGSRVSHRIDIDNEDRVGFLMEIACAQQSPALAALACQLVDTVVDLWEDIIPDFQSALSLLEKIGSNQWIMANGGQRIYRQLLNDLLDEEKLCFASAGDWLHLLPYPDKAPIWLDSDETALAKGLSRYQNQGVDDDRRACTTVDEMNDLKGSLDQLQDIYGLNFSLDIELLEEAMAERGERENKYQEGHGIPSGRTDRPRNDTTDDDIKQMFSTLREA